MRFCRRCLYSDLHPLGLIIDQEGICSGCRIHEEKGIIDWKERWSRLEQIVENYRSKSGDNYDCVVPVSGARDSFYIVHTVKKCLGLNPLLVTYNKQYNTAVGIRNLARLRTVFDCDILTKVVDPDCIKRITRATLRRWASIYWHCLAGQSVFPVQIAVKMKIPLIIWGHHQGLDQVGMFSHLDEVEMSRRYRRNHDLFKSEAETLVSDHDFICSEDIRPFKYPNDEEIAAIGVRGIYLGNFLRWDTKVQHEKMIELYDYETTPQTRTFDTYNDVDCWMHSDLHDYIKKIKWGYGRATDHAIRELRFGRVTREHAEEIIDFYENKEPQNIELFLDWIGITNNGLNFILNQHRNKRIWSFTQKNSDWEYSNEWLKAYKLANDNIDRLDTVSSPSIFRVRKSKPICDDESNFNLVGKGQYLPPVELEGIKL